MMPTDQKFDTRSGDTWRRVTGRLVDRCTRHRTTSARRIDRRHAPSASAVGDDDLQRVDDSVFATHRVLVTLNEARRRRRTLNTLIGQREDIGIHSLDQRSDRA